MYNLTEDWPNTKDILYSSDKGVARLIVFDAIDLIVPARYSALLT